MSAKTRVVLDDIIDKMTPKPKKRIITKERIVAVAGAASHLLGLVVAKRPQFAPLQLALASLLQPVDNDVPAIAAQNDAHRVLMQIKRLKDRLRSSTDDETQNKLKAQIETLYELLTDE